MKRNLILLLILLQAAALQVSCTKNDSATNATTETPFNYPAGWLVKTINKSTYTYDSRNRLVQINRQGGPDSARFRKFSYDNDKLIKVEDANGTYQELTYDGDKVSFIAKKSVNGGILDSYQFTFDAQGRVSQVKSWSEERSLITYGTDGLPTKIDLVRPGNTVAYATITFRNYSAECDFNPWIIADCQTISRIHPMMFAGLSRLPVTIQQPTQLGYMQADSYGYTVTDRKITAVDVMSRVSSGINLVSTAYNNYMLSY